MSASSPCPVARCGRPFAGLHTGPMSRSTVVEVDGVFVGAVLRQAGCPDWLFVATHDSVRALHGRLLPTLEAVQLQARQLMRRRG